MFLKSLHIANDSGVIRNIKFHSGMNLIVDETPSDGTRTTGNNVGKTTVLMLIDFCLGSSAKGIYTDPENKKNENAVVKQFLISTKALITLTLTQDLNSPLSDELVIERNFLPRKQLIRRINGAQRTEEEFEEFLTEYLFPGHYGKKPTFPQIISHNIRYKELSVTNTLRTLNQYTRDDEYESLYLFLLGCDFDRGDAKQRLLTQIRTESAFKSRLEGTQTRSAYEASLSLILLEIEQLDQKKATLKINPDFESDLSRLDEVKFEINQKTSQLSRLKMRKSLTEEAVLEVSSSHAGIDTQQLKELYKDVSERVSGVQKTFEELVIFHNAMVEEKARFISKDIPQLNASIAQYESEIAALLLEELKLTQVVAKSGSFAELEAVIVENNEKYRQRGEFETIIAQISDVEGVLEGLNKSLADIDEELFSSEFEAAIQAQLNKFNRHFSTISQELYGEQYALKVDRVTARNGQRVYKFSSFNTNFSSGKKQGEISCFDIAYNLFADEEGIPCLHFLLNDKKELMHDNQLTNIASLVGRQSKHVQFVASILRDKLPTELNQEKYFVVKLSQEDKLFKIE
ncbi:DUF2326 domain-containing protein [Pseudomonas chlororaphis]|uniref:DUF2326 domain-containing protein n=1 Tax=Pseudomonas chlororaphis TaxID=587753 RepID=A0A0D5Y0X6_9PSED|nr:DUF2326 domain-containing protein [Pseudomonas chlororaphis]AKA25003.1 hypothetical protein PCL1606_35520 [Pseudomonas chlororaphis]